MAAVFAMLPIISCLNPGLVNTISGGSQVPIAPGAQNFVLVQFINNSALFVDLLVTAESQEQTISNADLRSVFANVRPGGGDAAVVLQCPIDRVGLGDLNDLTSTGFRVGLSGAQKTGVTWGQAPLVAGFNFDCGDTVLFVAITDATASGSVRIDTGVIGAATQPQPAVDTFGNLETVLTLNGF